jgi:gas vesicle protein
MEQYIVGAVVGAVVTAIVCSLIKRPNSSLNNCKLENEQLKSKIAKQGKENEHLKGEVDRQKRTLRSEQERYDILRDKHDVVLTENLKLKKMISKMQSE